MPGHIDAEEEAMFGRRRQQERATLEEKMDSLYVLTERFAAAMVDELRGINHTLRRMGNIEMSAIDDLTAAVEAETTVNQSAVALLNSLAQEIRDAQDDPAKLAELADSIEANTSALSDAVTANTPAAPQTPADEAALPAETPVN